MALTAHAKTIDALLKQREMSLASFIADYRELGLSYAQIAAALSKATGGVVRVSGETIRNWTLDLQVAS